MSGAKIWSNVRVEVQSALGSAITISGITNASPGVASASGHGLSDGAFVVLSVAGMADLDGRVVRVANSDAGTFELEGVDTTNLGTFTSGSAQEITFGTNLGVVRSLSAAGGEFPLIDTTTIHDKLSTNIPGVPSPVVYTFTNIFDPSDAGVIALKAASDERSQRAVRFTFSDGTIMAFSGYIGASGIPTGSGQELVTSPATVTMSATPSYY